MDFRGKTFFITGAANGIGLYLAKTIIENGGYVFAADIQDDKLKSVYGDSKLVSTLKLDVTSATAWEKALKESTSTKPIDYLLNVAGIIRPGYIHKQDVRDIDLQIDINLKGTVYGCHFYSKWLVENNRKGHIINIASMAAVAPVGGLNAYTASKFGVRGFTLAIRQELKPYGIDVSVVCPDAVKTAMLDVQKDYKEAAMTFSMDKPLTVEDVGRIIFEDIIKKKKAEVKYPFYRGLMATVGSNFPGIADVLQEIIVKKGLKNQENYH